MRSVIDQRNYDVVGISALNLKYIRTVSRIILDDLEQGLASTVETGRLLANATYTLSQLELRCGYLWSRLGGRTLRQVGTRPSRIP